MKRILKLLSIICVYFVIFFKGNATEKIYSSGDKKIKKIALTFDDGPNTSSLSNILDLLKKEKIKASFFFVGNRVVLNKEEVKRAFDEGHLVLNHSYSHSNFGTATKDKVFSEIENTNSVIKDITGVSPKLYRPPYGIITENVKKAVSELGMNIVLWNVDGEDWNKKRTIEQVVSTQEKETKNGSVILMHTQPDKNTSYEALLKLIPYYRDKRYEFVKLDELLDIEAYKN